MPEGKGKGQPPPDEGPGRTERRGIPPSKSGKVLKKQVGGWVSRKPSGPGHGKHGGEPKKK